jgi:DNA-binding NtrC family response regulator
VALHRILVVDDSAAVRETLGILLGSEYDVEAVSVAEFATRPTNTNLPRLIIAARAASAEAPAAAFPPGVPVLWLDPRLNVAGMPSEVDAIPARFSPRRLRARVSALLTQPPPAGRGLARLSPPFVPLAVARVAADAVRAPLPLHLVGEPGVGKRVLARAIHDAGGHGAFVAVSGGALEIGPLAGASGGGTLFIDRVDHLPAAGQQALLAALAPSGRLQLGSDHALRVITSATDDLEAAVDQGAFSPDLYYRLTVFTARLPPLRERSHDIPALAAALAAELATALGRPAVALTERAQARLQNYLWFGNLAELEAVLARSIAITPRPLLDADDLRFEPQGAPQPRSAGNGRDALAAQSLDLIINELAHEFKNPLVTIKTFAHHLRRTLPNGAEEAHVARLTGEAVEQIDQTLENLLEFTRLDAPAPRSLSLASLLDPVLADCGRALGARGVRLDHEALPAVGVRGDPQQVAYALINLIRSVARDLPAGERVHIGFAPPASMIVQLPNGSEPFGNHLATLLDRPADAPHALPLGVAIAHAVLERNGAHIAVADGTPSTINVRFSLADGEDVSVGTNGSSPRTGR